MKTRIGNIWFITNPSLQGTGHLVDRTLQGVVQCLNEKGE
jgi:hypothetical protein